MIALWDVRNRKCIRVPSCDLWDEELLLEERERQRARDAPNPGQAPVIPQAARAPVPVEPDVLDWDQGDEEALAWGQGDEDADIDTDDYFDDLYSEEPLGTFGGAYADDDESTSQEDHHGVSHGDRNLTWMLDEGI